MKNLVLLLLFFGFSFISCKKNELGGKSTIKGVVKHHDKAIPYATVFIKFNAKEFPGKDTNLYNAKVKADATGNYNIGCYKGEYYLYGYGFDNALVDPLVVGGTPVKIRQNEVVEKEIAVTED